MGTDREELDEQIVRMRERTHSQQRRSITRTTLVNHLQLTRFDRDNVDAP
jgi:hypothetical protein